MRPGRAQALLDRPVSGLADRVLPLADRPDPSRRLDEAARLPAGPTIGETASRLRSGERRLHLLFTDGTGLSPKRFARIGRVRAVLAAGTGRWADIAAAAGSYDQSHRTGEFRRFTGVPPAACAPGVRPAATPCTA
ncbi:AraC family transcriptional regulator [Streptomyces sp. NE5-10]|uniref:helix-turn-helix domain-containing protein n=1 Tax=Streptomyces sp. NE5-10 TaxID=2759674 RepID=UPI001F5B9BCA|nr:AraC family transcriptional regulator [Streptomyces sp. NE5-10]